MPTVVEVRRKLERVFEKEQARGLPKVISSSYDELVKVSDFNAESCISTEEDRDSITEDRDRDAETHQWIERDEIEDWMPSRSVCYILANEAYRMLPNLLKDSYGIELKERLIRTEIGGKEINILGRARRNNQDILIVGGVKMRLDESQENKDVFRELEKKVLAVRKKYKEEVVRVLVTHYATKGFMKKAEQKGVIVVQSFEW